MGSANAKEKRIGIWITKKDGTEERLEGVLSLRFYGKEPREEPRAIFNPHHVLVPLTTEIRLESSEGGTLIRFRDSETFEELQALAEAKAAEDGAQGSIHRIPEVGTVTT